MLSELDLPSFDVLLLNSKRRFETSFRASSNTLSIVRYRCFFMFSVFRIDALALIVIATATWLAGWLGGWLGGWVAGWLSHSCIVSKRLKLSENFFDHLKAPSF